MLKNYLFLTLFMVSYCHIAEAQSIFQFGDKRNFDDPLQSEVTLLNPPLSKRVATITTPPTTDVRPMAEWEEIEAITITWTAYKATLSEIVRHAQLEVKVYINCVSAEKVKKDLDLFQVPYGDNVIFLENQNFNSVWIRDYGPNSAYLNDVDSLILIDWVYNRPTRPDDDVLPENIADQINTPLFQTTEGEFQLTATGGNFMSDGIGTGFSSRLVVDENQDKTELEIDEVMHDFLGVDNYVKFDKLQYDGIHHIDMHMKLLDEERIIFGEFPEGKADHDIIEANIEYLLSTQLNAFGEPYEIIRVPMPPSANTFYPGESNEAFFRTYTNALFINKTILVPTYQPIYDAEALRIWRQTMPGYNIVGIDCNELIDEFGAIHCITKEIGSKNPLRIVFQRLKDQEQPKEDGYTLQAIVQHRSGISGAALFYRQRGEQVYNRLNMELVDPKTDVFEATIPNYIEKGSIEYFVQGISNSGKVFNRPQPAPEAYYSFNIENTITSTNNLKDVFPESAFPNPSSDLVCIPIEVQKPTRGELSLMDIHGKLVKVIFEGRFESGSSKQFVNVSNLPSGLYTLRLTNAAGVYTQKLVVE